ncbi:MAG: oligosaccharide flippase family protein [Planctomycetota bacterium]
MPSAIGIARMAAASRRIVSGGVTLVLGQVLTQGGAFVRNALVARFIGNVNMGIAMTFAMTLALFEMVSNLNAEKLIIQAPDGDGEGFQRTVQLSQGLRGALSALLVLLSAGFLADWFGVPEARWAFRWLALIPLLKGFVHLDIHRVQRQLSFRQVVAVEGASEILTLAAAWPLVLWIGDFSVMLWLVLLKAGLDLAGSHLVASRRYGWSWEGATMRRILAFGGPLLVNGLLMYGIFQGDRLIIASEESLFGEAAHTLADLGIYSVAFLLTFRPTWMLAKVSSSLFLPLLSEVQEEPRRFDERYRICSQSLALVGGWVCLLFLLTSGWLVALIYGADYRAASSVIGWLGAMQALRMIRVAPTIAAMARADTMNSMVSNLARTAALIGVAMVAASGGSLAAIAACGFGGEALALVTCLARLRLVHRVPAAIVVRPLVVAAACVAAALLVQPEAGHEWLPSLALTAAFSLLLLGVLARLHPELREGLRMLLRRRRGGLAAARETG